VKAPRRRDTARPGVYLHLLERKRATVSTYGHLRGPPYPRQLARLEAGEPVEVSVHELPDDFGMPGWWRVRMWPDDRIEVVDRFEASER